LIGPMFAARHLQASYLPSHTARRTCVRSGGSCGRDRSEPRALSTAARPYMPTRRKGIRTSHPALLPLWMRRQLGSGSRSHPCCFVATALRPSCSCARRATTALTSRASERATWASAYSIRRCRCSGVVHGWLSPRTHTSPITARFCLPVLCFIAHEIRTFLQAARFAQLQHAVLVPLLSNIVDAAVPFAAKSSEDSFSHGSREEDEIMSSAGSTAQELPLGQADARTGPFVSTKQPPSSCQRETVNESSGEAGISPPSMSVPELLRSGLRVAMVDIDAHAGNGTQASSRCPY
jgi:hypothetical protein